MWRTKAEQFRAAHARAGQGEPLTLGHPEFEGFESVLALLPKGRAA
jgi:heme-degrading monooxygenase HmoA